jgi:hypothetical protein
VAFDPIVSRPPSRFVEHLLQQNPPYERTSSAWPVRALLARADEMIECGLRLPVGTFRAWVRLANDPICLMTGEPIRANLAKACERAIA